MTTKTKNTDFTKVDLGKLAKQLRSYEKQWIAISEKNSIVANGKTYGETLKKAEDRGLREVILFKVPPLDYSLAPESCFKHEIQIPETAYW